MDNDLRSRYRVERPDPAVRPQGPAAAPRVIFKPPAPDQPVARPAHTSVSANPFIQAGSQAAPQPKAQPTTFTPSPPIIKRHRSKKLLVATLVLVMLAGSASAAYLFGPLKPKSDKSAAETNQIPLPTTILNETNFPVYYPSPMPHGYTYQTGSASYANGLFYYKLSNGSKSVAFIEQTLPAKVPNLNSIPNFGKIDIPAGQAAIGTVAGQPTALVTTAKTLMNISSTGSVSLTDIKDLANALIPYNSSSK